MIFVSFCYTECRVGGKVSKGNVLGFQLVDWLVKILVVCKKKWTKAKKKTLFLLLAKYIYIRRVYFSQERTIVLDFFYTGLAGCLPMSIFHIGLNMIKIVFFSVVVVIF
jgi:hypothetical protein